MTMFAELPPAARLALVFLICVLGVAFVVGSGIALAELRG